MTTESEWYYYHQYRLLAARGMVKHLTCPDCGSNLITRIRKDDDDVWLWCAADDAWTRPGLDVFTQIKAVVREHTLD